MVRSDTKPDDVATTSSEKVQAASLWIWRCRNKLGDWLPEALISQVAGRRPRSEPFSAEGEYPDGAKGWRSPLQREAAERRLRQWVLDSDNLVHTADGFDDAFHQALAEATALQPGRHLLLHVRDPMSRLVGRLAALQSAPPLPKLLDQDREGLSKLARVHLALNLTKQAVHLVALDDLASGGHAEEHWRGLWRFLGAEALAGSRQPAWRERLALDLAEARARLDRAPHDGLQRESRWIGDLERAPAFLEPLVLTPAASDGPVRLVRLDRMPAVLGEGDSIRIGGVVVPATLQPDARLLLRQGAVRQRLAWGQPSPAVAAKRPGEPAAANSRFKPISVTVRRREPARILYRTDERAAPVPVAIVTFKPHGREPIDGIYSAPWSVGYQPIPKAACTSIKEVLFRLTQGVPFSPAVAEGAGHIHRYFDLRHQDVSAAAFRFVVVRDPIKRFLSAFSNRVLHHKELSRQYVEALHLEPALDLSKFLFDPSLAQFVEQFESYRRVPTIDHHFRPISEFTAPLSAFDKVYPFEALDELMKDLQSQTGIQIKLPHSQRGGPKLSAKDLPPKVFDRLVEIYSADYAMLSHLYSPHSLR